MDLFFGLVSFEIIFVFIVIVVVIIDANERLVNVLTPKNHQGKSHEGVIINSTISPVIIIILIPSWSVWGCVFFRH